VAVKQVNTARKTLPLIVLSLKATDLADLRQCFLGKNKKNTHILRALAYAAHNTETFSSKQKHGAKWIRQEMRAIDQCSYAHNASNCLTLNVILSWCREHWLGSVGVYITFHLCFN